MSGWRPGRPRRAGSTLRAVGTTDGRAARAGGRGGTQGHTGQDPVAKAGCRYPASTHRPAGGTLGRSAGVGGSRGPGRLGGPEPPLLLKRRGGRQGLVEEASGTWSGDHGAKGLPRPTCAPSLGCVSPTRLPTRAWGLPGAAKSPLTPDTTCSAGRPPGCLEVGLGLRGSGGGGGEGIQRRWGFRPPPTQTGPRGFLRLFPACPTFPPASPGLGSAAWAGRAATPAGPLPAAPRGGPGRPTLGGALAQPPTSVHPGPSSGEVSKRALVPPGVPRLAADPSVTSVP